MSHQRAANGRPVVECDDPVRESETGALRRCGRRTAGRRDDRAFLQPLRLGLFDLPRGWSVAPYSADFDHGATRRSLLDGAPISPLPWLVGVRGDLHTCPDCRRAERVDAAGIRHAVPRLVTT